MYFIGPVLAATYFFQKFRFSTYRFKLFHYISAFFICEVIVYLSNLILIKLIEDVKNEMKFIFFILISTTVLHALMNIVNHVNLIWTTLYGVWKIQTICDVNDIMSLNKTIKYVSIYPILEKSFGANVQFG